MNSLNPLVTLLLPSIVAAVISLIVNHRLKAQELVVQARWQIKHQACLDALKVVDAHFSNVEWKDNATGNVLDVVKQDEPSMALVRECDNRLVLSCDKKKSLFVIGGVLVTMESLMAALLWISATQSEKS